MAVRVCISVLDMERWSGGDFAAVTDMVALADRKGIDQVTVVEHVVMSENTDPYPFGKFMGKPDSPWPDPMMQLATYAGVTKNMTLSSGIVISPLRPAVVLAKQLATLDVLSRGRVEIGFGTGWQKEEYDACGVPFEDRFAHMEEQIRVCKQMWREAPTSFHGKHVNFDRLWCIPFPVKKNIPVYLGVAPTGKNIARIAELCEGWLPMEQDPAKLVEPVARIKEAFRAHGRDPESLVVRASLKAIFTGGKRADLEETLKQWPDYAKAGVNIARFPVTLFCRGQDEYEKFLDRLVAFQNDGR